MPYIRILDREKFEQGLLELEKVIHKNGITPGELNYLITELCISYKDKKGVTYTHYNDVIGALESAKLEFYRRSLSNYEDEKAKENGDVY